MNVRTLMTGMREIARWTKVDAIYISMSTIYRTRQNTTKDKPKQYEYTPIVPMFTASASCSSCPLEFEQGDPACPSACSLEDTYPGHLAGVWVQKLPSRHVLRISG